MNYTLIDAARLLVACVGCVPILVLPGAALARVLRPATRPDAATAAMTGLALLPLIDSLATRLLSLDVALALTLALAAVAVLRRGDGSSRPRLDARAVALALAWLALVVFEWVDVDVGGRLFQSFTVFDTVKHAAMSEAILDTGAPPRDPFFLRPQPVSYYYFFYTLAALLQRSCGGLIDGKAAVGGLVFWSGLGLYGLVRLAFERAGLGRVGARPGLVVALLAAGGLDIIAVLKLGLVRHTWPADPVAWNEQVTGWTESLLWVPHHVTGLIASVVGLVALTDAVDAGERRRNGSVSGPRDAWGAGVAGLCFASAFGTSVWVALGLVATVALWGGVLLFERRWRALTPIAAAGALALLVGLPQIRDVLANRAVGAVPPIVPSVRAFSPLEVSLPPGAWLQLARLLALPLNYFAAFGVLASGSIAYWQARRTSPAAPSGEFHRVLALAAGTGLLLGALLRSTLLNNDLGWRVTLFPLLAGTVWTLHVLVEALGATGRAGPSWRRVPGFLLGLAALGWATTLYGLVSLRAYPLLPTQPDAAFLTAHPATERALRVAGGWADGNLPAGAVLQHDPSRQRAFAFALYGRHPVAVGDAYGSIFGANEAVVRARIAALTPIYRTLLPDATVRAAAEAAGVDDLVVTDADPVWSMPASFVWRGKAVYASQRVRILPVADLERTAIAVP